MRYVSRRRRHNCGRLRQREHIFIDTATSQVREPPLTGAQFRCQRSCLPPRKAKHDRQLFLGRDHQDVGHHASGLAYRRSRNIGTPLPFLENNFYLVFSINLVCLSRLYVNCVQGCRLYVNSNILVSCSHDKTIKMWDITSGSCLSTWTGHSSA